MHILDVVRLMLCSSTDISSVSAALKLLPSMLCCGPIAGSASLVVWGELVVDQKKKVPVGGREVHKLERWMVTRLGNRSRKDTGCEHMRPCSRGVMVFRLPPISEVLPQRVNPAHRKRPGRWQGAWFTRLGSAGAWPSLSRA